MESKFVSVDSFLQELVGQGQLDSTGSFTLSLEHARQKLSEFLLESTNEYLLKLIQAGVAAGAESLELHSDTTKVSFLMNGVSFDPAELRQILNHLLQPGGGSQGRALKHLATAVNTAVMTRATGISLASWDGKWGERIEWKADGRQSKPWKPYGSKPRLLFEVRRTGYEFVSQFMHLLSQRDILSMLLGQRAGLDPDRLLVLDRAIWCPVPLALNGRWLPRPALGPADATAGFASSRPRLDEVRWLEREDHDPGIRAFQPKGKWWPWSRHYSEARGGVLGTGRQAAFETVRSQMHWIYDGIHVASGQLSNVPLGTFAWGVLSAHGCVSDLTGLKLVQNEVMEARAQRMHKALHDTLGYPPPTLPTPRDPKTPPGPVSVDRLAAWEVARRRRKRNSE